MSQVLITAAFMFLFHFPSTLMAELKVESDKENVVSSRLEGRWEANKAISNRLSTRLADHNQSKTVEFHADDKIVAKIPGKYGTFRIDGQMISWPNFMLATANISVPLRRYLRFSPNGCGICAVTKEPKLGVNCWAVFHCHPRSPVSCSTIEERAGFRSPIAWIGLELTFELISGSLTTLL